MNEDAIAAGLSPAASAEENRAALQAALDTGKHVWLGDNGYFGRVAPGLLMRRQGQRVFGGGAYSTTIQKAGTGDLFAINGLWGCTFRGFRIIGSEGDAGQVITDGGGFGIAVDGRPAWGGSALQAQGTDIEDVVMTSLRGGVFVSDHNQLRATDVQMLDARGPGWVATALVPEHRVDVISLSGNCVYQANLPAAQAGGCVGVRIDGFVHTISLGELRVVTPTQGVAVLNTAGLPFGQYAAFLQSSRLEIDFPVQEGLFVTHCAGVELAALYCHGSKSGDGVSVGPAVDALAILSGRVTGHARSGIATEARQNDFVALKVTGNSQQALNGHSAYLLGANVQRASFLGGSTRHNPATDGAMRHAYAAFKAGAGTLGFKAGWDAVGNVLPTWGPAGAW